MASAIHSTLPLVMTTRFDGSQCKPRSVQEYLLSLKKPGSKAQTAMADLIGRDQDVPPSAAVESDDLPDHAPLGEYRSNSPPSTKVPANNPLIPRLQGSPSTKSPESGAPQSLCSSHTANSAGIGTEPAVTDLTNSLDVPKVIQIYTRKRKPKLPPTEDLPDSSLPFCPQPSTANQGQIPENLEATSQVQELKDLVELQNDQQRALRVGAPTVDAAIREPSRKGRKRRRAPVNDLALVAELPMHANPPDEEFNEQGRTKCKDSYEANVGRPMTKSRRDPVTPRRNSIDPQDFKFPPTTPKHARSFGWTPGSGFEGTTLQTLVPSTLTHQRRTARRTKLIRFAVSPTRPLELSTELSPTVKASNPPLLKKAPKSLALPLEAACRLQSPRASQDSSTEYGELVQHIDKAASAGETMSSQIQMSTSLPKPRTQVNQLAKSGILDDDLLRQHSSSRQKSPSRKRGVDSQAIRRPSKSERNGWLKRRMRVSFAGENEQRTLQSAEDSRQSDENDDTEQLFEAHNAIWYGKDAQADPCFRTSTTRSPQVQATRSP